MILMLQNINDKAIPSRFSCTIIHALLQLTIVYSNRIKTLKYIYTVNNTRKNKTDSFSSNTTLHLIFSTNRANETPSDQDSQTSPGHET